MSDYSWLSREWIDGLVFLITSLNILSILLIKKKSLNILSILINFLKDDFVYSFRFLFYNMLYCICTREISTTVYGISFLKGFFYRLYLLWDKDMVASDYQKSMSFWGHIVSRDSISCVGLILATLDGEVLLKYIASWVCFLPLLDWIIASRYYLFLYNLKESS